MNQAEPAKENSSLNEKWIKKISDFKPFEKLDICSNTLINTTYIIIINNFIPLLVGKGTSPRIWLHSTTPDRKWVQVVNDNISLHKDIIVKKEPQKTIINYKDKTLIEILGDKNEGQIEKLDLTPLGLNIHGNNQGLFIGKRGLINVTVRNANGFVMLGK